jgi:nicotinamide mononucleotide adenylyltransferase
MLTCSSLFHIEQYSEQHPIYVIDPDELLLNPSLLQSAVSPRMVDVLAFSSYKSEIQNQNSEQNEKMEKINKIAGLEVEFEKCRRQITSKLPSRPISIFLAEDNLDGRIMLQNMFNSKRNIRIVSINITCMLRFHKADSKWVNIYEETSDKTAIENYWKGISFDNKPQYEYLLDGQIELKSILDKEILKERSMFLYWNHKSRS